MFVRFKQNLYPKKLDLRQNSPFQRDKTAEFENQTTAAFEVGQNSQFSVLAKIKVVQEESVSICSNYFTNTLKKWFDPKIPKQISQAQNNRRQNFLTNIWIFELLEKANLEKKRMATESKLWRLIIPNWLNKNFCQLLIK